jgi:hypothetical protein
LEYGKAASLRIRARLPGRLRHCADQISIDAGTLYRLITLDAWPFQLTIPASEA